MTLPMGATMAAFDQLRTSSDREDRAWWWAYERRQLHALTAKEGILELTPREQPPAGRIQSARRARLSK
jgi:hypothetical protein